MTDEQTYQMLAQYAPHKRLCSDEEHEAGPDFAGITQRLDQMGRLSLEGWWANWGGCMYAETILRDFGPLVEIAAEDCYNEDDDRSRIYTTFMIRCADSYLQWEEECASSDDAAARRLIRDARNALSALGSHIAATDKAH